MAEASTSDGGGGVGDAKSPELTEELALKSEIPAASAKVSASIRMCNVQRQLRSQSERLRSEKARRREVFDAICELTEPVPADVMMSRLDALDASTWNEVIEERFLGRLCGYPVCDKPIRVDFSKKFVIDKRRNMVCETQHEVNKFCSDECLGASRAIQSQLYPQPLWLTGERPPKKYKIPTDFTAFLAEFSASERHKKPTPMRALAKAKNVPDLVRRVEELVIADSVESNSSDEDGDFERNDDADLDAERDEKEFICSIRSNSTTKAK